MLSLYFENVRHKNNTSEIDKSILIITKMRITLICQAKQGWKFFEFEFKKNSKIVKNLNAKWSKAKTYGKIRQGPKMLNFGASKPGVDGPGGLGPSLDPHLAAPVCYIVCGYLPIFVHHFVVYYRPQKKFAKVMFLHTSVCPQGGVPGQVTPG